MYKLLYNEGQYFGEKFQLKEKAIEMAKKSTLPCMVCKTAKGKSAFDASVKTVKLVEVYRNR